ncbi:MAG: shikimate kinase [Nitrospinae bacterium]|nr:shikimate kinase [Nitrospinota bacterium]MZH05887.1 shikimate kinase [Nitrospinota bacterium]MZH13593.1 shikimate kinase [Nitrospinota bacterium]
MNIVMLGYRGTGKSVISKILSEKLRMRLYKIDKMISDSVGKSIPEIVEKEGWESFRKLESEIVAEVSNKAQNSIIDCGGGVVLNDSNIVNLKKEGVCIVLTASLETIIKRIRHDKNRPSLEKGLSFEEEQKKILAERESKYRAAADFICDTSQRRPRETAGEITEFLRSKGWIEK